MTRSIPLAAGLLLACGAFAAEDSPARLRSEMAKAEQQYIELYNKLNTVREFDIRCVTDRPTGSALTNRVCRPEYLLRAQQRSASERLQSAAASGESTGAANARGPNVGAATSGGDTAIDSGKNEAFKQNVLQVQQNSPELQALGKKRDELQARLQEAAKAR